MWIVLTLFFIYVALVSISFELREIRRCLHKRDRFNGLTKGGES